jgi:hypothetical protein
MSRSAFAVRFKDLVGETPLEYLTGWRMRKATGLLQKGDKKLFEVAKSVGYGSGRRCVPLEYQACDKTRCYIPMSIPVSWQLQVLPLDRTRAPAEIRHK